MNKTKHSLFMSAISLLLCISMLLGTTFAWFTDEVVSTGNKIQSGTLKVDLELLDKETGKWNSLKETKAPIFNYDKWEPGYVDTKILKVENEGNLALKWVAQFYSANQLSILADAIDVYVCPSESEIGYPAERDLTGYTPVGSLRTFINSIQQTTWGTLEAKKSAYLGIALKMREDAGNEYQNLSLGGAFDIRIYATQHTSEADSFDNQYDKNATFEDLANTSLLATETKTLAAGADSVEFNLASNGMTLAAVTVPASAIEDPSQPVTVTFDGIDPSQEVIIDENTQAYAFDINVTNLKENLADDQLITVVVTAPNALAAMKAYHNGVLIEDAVYDEVAGTITFQTASFSPYNFTSQVEPVSTLEGLRAALQNDGTTAKLTANIEVDLTKETGAARHNDHAYVGSSATYYNGVMINGKNVGLDLNGHSITAFCGDNYNSNSDVGALFFVGANGSLNITNTGNVSTGFIKMRSSIYAVWAPFADPSYVDIYGGAFIADSYAGDPIGTSTNPGSADGTMKNENSNRALIYAGFGGNMNVYGGYFLYNNTPNDLKNRNNGAFNAKDFYSEEDAAAKGPLLTIHDGVYMINKEYRQNPQYTSQPNGDYDNYSVVLEKSCKVETVENHSVTIDGKPYDTWYRVSSKRPVSLTVDGLQEIYAAGDTLNLTVKANYTYGSEEITDYQMTAVDMSTAGVKIVTVSYTAYDKTVSTTFEVRVIAPVRIKVDVLKNTFNVGTKLTTKDFKVTAYSSDGKSTTVSNFDISKKNALTVNDTAVTITDTTNDLSATVAIRVMNITRLDGTANEKDLYWFFPGVFSVSSGVNSAAWPMYEAYLNGGYPGGGNGETVTGFKTGLSYVGPNNGKTNAGAIVDMVDGAYGLTIDNALPYTTLGIGCIAGYSDAFKGYGYIINNDASTLEYTPYGGVYTASNPGGIVDGIHTVYDLLGQYNGHAMTQFTCYGFEPGEQYTVTWVAVFDDGIQKISDWTVNMAPASENNKVFIDNPDKTNVNVIVLAGQSNMYGASPIIPAVRENYANVDYSNVYIHYNNINVDFEKGGLKTYYSNTGFDMYTLGIGAQGNNYFGPEAALAKALATNAATKDEQWYIIKYAAAGTGLKDAWLTGAVVNSNATTLYAEMKDYVQTAITNLENQGYDVQIRSFLWMQGENDALSAGAAGDYGGLENWMVNDFRTTFASNATRNASNLPGSSISFIDAGIANYKSGINAWEHAATVNNGKLGNAQQVYDNAAGTLVANPTGALTNSLYIETGHLPSKLEVSADEQQYYPAGDETDGAHYAASSMETLGGCFALCTVMLVEQNP